MLTIDLSLQDGHLHWKFDNNRKEKTGGIACHHNKKGRSQCEDVLASINFVPRNTQEKNAFK